MHGSSNSNEEYHAAGGQWSLGEDDGGGVADGCFWGFVFFKKFGD